MRRHRDGDQEVAGAAAGAGQSLSLQPDLLALVEPGRDLHLDLLAGGQRDPLLHALGGFRKRDGKRGGDVAAGRGAEILRLEMDIAAGAGAAGGAASPEHIFEDGLEAAKAARAGAAARRVDALGAPGEGLEPALVTEAAAGAPPPAEAFAALEPRLAFGVDLAAVERLALVLVA